MPVAYIAIYQGSTRLDYKYYVDQFHKPILRAAGSHPGQYIIYVQYEFVGSPHKDFTLKAYSKYSNKIKDSSGNTNELHMDGSTGSSGFTNSNFAGMNAPTSSFDCCKFGSSTQNCNPNLGSSDPPAPPAPTPAPEEEKPRDVSEVPVKSLVDVFENAETFEEFFEFLWYNPWVTVVWFHFW